MVKADSRRRSPGLPDHVSHTAKPEVGGACSTIAGRDDPICWLQAKNMPALLTERSAHYRYSQPRYADYAAKWRVRFPDGLEGIAALGRATSLIMVGAQASTAAKYSNASRLMMPSSNVDMLADVARCLIQLHCREFGTKRSSQLAENRLSVSTRRQPRCAPRSRRWLGCQMKRAARVMVK
jgi:hypothetical protein